MSLEPAPDSGKVAHQFAIAAELHYHYFTGAATPLEVLPGDSLVTFVLLDPANLPQEVMPQWYDGNSWAHAAYWGANLIARGANDTVSRRSMGALPSAGQWTKLEVPAGLVGLDGRSVSGMNFVLYGGRAIWDSSGKSSP
ncbi:MAG: hypothetical protein HY735_06635 [Verrucomicrobia bacterium]|nr:hypothetical protein [Verrucomicrobiota bacterium]